MFLLVRKTNGKNVALQTDRFSYLEMYFMWHLLLQIWCCIATFILNWKTQNATHWKMTTHRFNGPQFYWEKCILSKWKRCAHFAVCLVIPYSQSMTPVNQPNGFYSERFVWDESFWSKSFIAPGPVFVCLFSFPEAILFILKYVLFSKQKCLVLQSVKKKISEKILFTDSVETSSAWNHFIKINRFIINECELDVKWIRELYIEVQWFSCISTNLDEIHQIYQIVFFFAILLHFFWHFIRLIKYLHCNYSEFLFLIL